MPKIPLKAIRKALKEAHITRPVAKAQTLADPMPGAPKVLAGQEVEVAEDIVATRMRDIDPEDTHQINFDLITTPEEVKETIAAVAERDAVGVDKARRGRIGNDELKALAADLNLDADVIAPVMMRESGGVLNPEQIYAARVVLNKSGARLRALTNLIKTGNASDRDKLAFRRQFEWHNQYYSSFMGARAEWGRSGGAFNIPAGTDELEYRRLHELANVMQGGDVHEMAKLIDAAGSIQGINTAVSGYRGNRAMGVLQEVFINSILSGPKTHAVNLGAAPVFQLMNAAELAVAAQIGKFLPGDSHVQVGEASAMLYGSLTGWRDALKVAGKTLKTGQSSDNIHKLEMGHQPAISSQTFPEVKAIDRKLKEWGMDTPIAEMALDALGTIIRSPTERALSAEDDFMKVLFFRSHIAQMAHRAASEQMKLGKLADKDVGVFLRNFMDNPPRGATDSAQDYALYGTFQTPLGPKGQAIQKIVNQTPGLKLIAPFIRTPTNLFKAGFGERSPTALLSKKFRAQLKGEHGGPARDLAFARLSMGSLTAGVVATAVAAGHITGGGPTNFAARKVLEATGWKPYSIVYTDPVTGRKKYQSYARVEPLAYVIGAVADAVEILSYVDFDDELTPEAEQAMQLVTAIVAGIAENTMSKTFVSGVNDFMNAVEDPERHLESYMKRQAGAFIPFSALRRDMTKIQDPYIREAWTMAERMRKTSGLGGFAEELSLSLDIYGDPRRYVRGGILGPMSPWPAEDGKDKPVAYQVAALMKDTNRVPVTSPSRRIEGLRLSATEYNDYVNLSRNEVEIRGMNFEEYLSYVFDGVAYDRMGSDGKVDMIRNAQSQFDAEARRQLVEQYDTGEPNSLAERLRERSAIRQERKLGDLL